jgi:GNAT superfamily N-acetyltransferase
VVGVAASSTRTVAGIFTAVRGLSIDVVDLSNLRKRPCGETVVVSEHAAPEDLQFLEEQINEYNFATTGIRDARLLVTLLRDSAGRIYGGLSGHTWGGVAEVRFLWVDETRRHAGVGSRLLQAAEDEARARGCTKVVLSTHSFQAPDFYLKRGYVVTGEFSNYPQGHRSIFLEKYVC